MVMISGEGMKMNITSRARYLRTQQTEAEKKLWLFLRNRQMAEMKFYRQFPIPPYTVDFCCRSIDLIIEVDGGQHFDSKDDEIRTQFLESKGYTVLRFWNNQVLDEMDSVLQKIYDEIQTLTRSD